MHHDAHGRQLGVVLVETRESRPADDWEVAEELGLELEEYYRILGNIHSSALLSLDEYVKSDDNDASSKKSFQERVVSTDNPAENVSRQELKQVITKAIQSLTTKEQTVISLYYYDELTLKEIGHVMSLTESRICHGYC